MIQGTREGTSGGGVLADGEPWRTPYFVVEGAGAGPTVIVTAGVHGNELASVEAADRLCDGSIRRGRLVVLPRANVRALEVNQRWTPGVERELGNLNRNFPQHEGDESRGLLAAAIWTWLQSFDPDWVLDLHEGLDFRRLNAGSVGNTVIVHPTEEGLEAAGALIQRLDATVDVPDKRFVLLETAKEGALSRASAELLGAQSMILETTTKEPFEVRVEQHGLAVGTLLDRLAMC